MGVMVGRRSIFIRSTAAVFLLAACRQVAGIGDVHLAGDGGGGGCGPDLETDPHDCGVCGHDCQGGDCAAGRCQPFVLAENAAAPNYIVADPT
jgi:hypothetical protein